MQPNVIQSNSVSALRHDLNTDELAGLLRVRPQTIRAGLSKRGHYCGLIPKKLPNRLLLWSASAVEQLLEGGAK